MRLHFAHWAPPHTYQARNMNIEILGLRFVGWNSYLVNSCAMVASRCFASSIGRRWIRGRRNWVMSGWWRNGLNLWYCQGHTCGCPCAFGILDLCKLSTHTHIQIIYLHAMVRYIYIRTHEIRESCIEMTFATLHSETVLLATVFF